MTTREQLNAAGLETETCPMQDCFGHMAKVEHGFRCTLCGVRIADTEQGATWNQTRLLMDLILKKWEAEERIEEKLCGFWTLDSDQEITEVNE